MRCNPGLAPWLPLEPPMSQRRQLLAHRSQPLSAQFTRYPRLTLALHRQQLAPGVGQQAVAPGQTALGRGQHDSG